MDVIQKIDNLRKERGWSAYKLAEEAILTPSTISNMFTRGTVPTIYTLEQICEAFGITLAEFFSEEVKLNSQDEVALLANYRKLESKDKKVVRKLTEFMSVKESTAAIKSQ